MDRAISLARLNEHARAAATAAAVVGRLDRLANASSMSRLFYTAACVQAHGLGRRPERTRARAPEREAAANQYAVAAVACLAKAAKSGYFRNASTFHEMGKDADLDALRSR